MKKNLIAMLVIGLMVVLAGSAMAAPIDVSGSIKTEFRNLDDQSTAVEGGKASFYFTGVKLNLSTEIDKNTTVFGRFSKRSDYGDSYEWSTDQSDMLDQYGLKVKSGDWNFVLGRQAVSLGKGLIIDTGSNYAGVDNKFDGIVASTSVDGMPVKIIAGKNTDTIDLSDNTTKTWYGLDVSKKLSDEVTIGAAYAAAKDNTSHGPYLAPSNAATTLKTWAVNASFKVTPSFVLNTEYAGSNKATDKNAYFVGGTYSWDKDSLTAMYSKVDKNAVDQFNSGFGNIAMPMGSAFYNNNVTAYTYVYSHPLTEKMTLNLVYLDLSAEGYAGNNKEFAANLTWNF